MSLGDAPGLRAVEQLVDTATAGVAVPDGFTYTELPPPAESAGEPSLPDPVEGEGLDVPVTTALQRARRDMGYVGKKGRYEQGQTKYNYRGVDQVVNAARPVLDRHGLVVVPEVAHYEQSSFSRQGGGRSHESFVTMRYWVYGPRGDCLLHPVVVIGQANDTSDKDAAKAQSVAWRVALIQLLHIATGDPDPDSMRIERAETPFDPNAYRDEATDPRTSAARLSQMIHELRTLGKGHVVVENETGDAEKLGNLCIRIRKERGQ